MSAREGFSVDKAWSIGTQIGIDWDSAPFDVEQFRRGMDVELEHGAHDPRTNVTDDDPLVTGKSRSPTSTSLRTTTPGSRRWRSRRKRDHANG